MNSRHLRFNSPLAVTLEGEDARWLRSKWARIRASQSKADKAAAQWESLNEALDEKLDRQGEYDALQRDRVKSANLGLKGFLSAHKWHADEAVRHIQDVQLFLKLKEIGAL